MNPRLQELIGKVTQSGYQSGVASYYAIYEDQTLVSIIRKITGTKNWRSGHGWMIFNGDKYVAEHSHGLRYSDPKLDELTFYEVAADALERELARIQAALFLEAHYGAQPHDRVTSTDRRFRKPDVAAGERYAVWPRFADNQRFSSHRDLCFVRVTEVPKKGHALAERLDGTGVGEIEAKRIRSTLDAWMTFDGPRCLKKAKADNEDLVYATLDSYFKEGRGSFAEATAISVLEWDAERPVDPAVQLVGRERYDTTIGILAEEALTGNRVWISDPVLVFQNVRIWRGIRSTEERRNASAEAAATGDVFAKVLADNTNPCVPSKDRSAMFGSQMISRYAQPLELADDDPIRGFDPDLFDHLSQNADGTLTVGPLLFAALTKNSVLSDALFTAFPNIADRAPFELLAKYTPAPTPRPKHLPEDNPQ